MTEEHGSENTESESESKSKSKSNECYQSYKRAIENVLYKIPVKNGAVDVRSIWVETCLPRDLIREIIRENSIQLPDHVERIVDSFD
ncbi:MAG: hypothetical protein ACE5JP_01925 [Candidatus Bipolaricaulia bacterium]